MLNEVQYLSVPRKPAHSRSRHARETAYSHTQYFSVKRKSAHSRPGTLENSGFHIGQKFETSLLYANLLKPRPWHAAEKVFLSQDGGTSNIVSQSHQLKNATRCALGLVKQRYLGYILKII